ncbi:MAG TPA: S8 family serine peptidase [Steroidobacteraceae bacterium]|nr:S8 family serine peptidase [Steroidobacteraceae bacterium]
MPETKVAAPKLRVAALTVLALLIGGLGAPQSRAGDSVVFRHQAVDPSLTDRIIVKWRTSGVAAVQMQSVQERATRLSAVNGIQVSPVHNLFGSTDVMRLDHTPTHSEMQGVLARLNADPGIEYAEPDGYRYVEAVLAGLPNDPHFLASTDPSNASNPDLNTGSWQGQWYLLPSSSTTPSALSATTAWQQSTTGSASIVVAVIDTGIIEAHPDLAGKLQPGYDFVSCDQGNLTVASGGNTTADCSATGSAATYYFANDGEGWHPDASDPGDWIDAGDAAMTLFINAGCTTVAPSSWHGTKVAGLIGALTNNGLGIAGVAPLTTLLPVRAIGKCSGRVSDIAAAIMWAAGQQVTVDIGSIAASPAANIINLSLGANTSCSSTEQSAIGAAIAAGILVVAAAGNEGGAIDAPANCAGVLSVVGLRETGTKVPFSNLSGSGGPAATIAAPGGNCVNTVAGEPCLFDIETTSDGGSTTPSPTPGFYTYSQLTQSYLNSGGNPDNAANVGTSFAAPMVSGVAALMLALNASLTPTQLIARMESSALAFPTSSPTSNTQCQLADSTADTNGNFTEPTTPTECVCTTATCGAGMVNAASAVLAAAGMFVQITPSSTTGYPGQRIKLDGSASTAATGYTIASYQWATIPATSGQLVNANQAIATLVVPSFRTIQAILTITDNVGRSASATTTIRSALGEASGAGGFQGRWLWPLAVLALWQLYRRRQSKGRVLN